jgi:hypothetical protein
LPLPWALNCSKGLLPTLIFSDFFLNFFYLLPLFIFSFSYFSLFFFWFF